MWIVEIRRRNEENNKQYIRLVHKNINYVLGRNAVKYNNNAFSADSIFVNIYENEDKHISKNLLVCKIIENESQEKLQCLVKNNLSSVICNMKFSSKDENMVETYSLLKTDQLDINIANNKYILKVYHSKEVINKAKTNGNKKMIDQFFKSKSLNITVKPEKLLNESLKFIQTEKTSVSQTNCNLDNFINDKVSKKEKMIKDIDIETEIKIIKPKKLPTTATRNKKENQEKAVSLAETFFQIKKPAEPNFSQPTNNIHDSLIGVKSFSIQPKIETIQLQSLSKMVNVNYKKFKKRNNTQNESSAIQNVKKEKPKLELKKYYDKSIPIFKTMNDLSRHETKNDIKLRNHQSLFLTD